MKDEYWLKVSKEETMHNIFNKCVVHPMAILFFVLVAGCTQKEASDRLANDPDSPSGVTYDFAFATDVVRVVVAFIAQEAKLVHKPVQR